MPIFPVCGGLRTPAKVHILHPVPAEDEAKDMGADLSSIEYQAERFASGLVAVGLLCFVVIDLWYARMVDVGPHIVPMVLALGLWGSQRLPARVGRYMFHGVLAALVVAQTFILYAARTEPNIGILWYLVLPIIVAVTGRMVATLVWTLVCVAVPIGLVLLNTGANAAWDHPLTIVNLLAAGVVGTAAVLLARLLENRRARILEAAIERERAQAAIIGKSARDAQHRAERAVHMSTTLAHELRSAMTAILLEAESLHSAEPEDISGVNERIRQVSKITLETFTGLLDLTKFEAGYSTFRMERFPATSLFEGIERICAPVALQSGLDFFVLPDARLRTHYIGDLTRLRQVVVNLVTNAVKYARRGDIVVSLKARSEGLWIEVADGGVGFDPADSQRMFKAYEQGAETSQEGVGMGLALVHRWVALMGGNVRVSTELGSGTCVEVMVPMQADGGVLADQPLRAPPQVHFVGGGPVQRAWVKAWCDVWGVTVTEDIGVKVDLTQARTLGGLLKACRQEADEEEEKGATKEPAQLRTNWHGKSCLVVDDDRMVRRSLKRLLRSWGLEVTAVSSGTHALSFLEEQDVDVVLLDHRMDELSGLDVLRTLGTKRLAQLPVLVLSGESQVSEQARSLGARECLTKPIPSKRLAQVIDSVLAG